MYKNDNILKWWEIALIIISVIIVTSFIIYLAIAESKSFINSDNYRVVRVYDGYNPDPISSYEGNVKILGGSNGSNRIRLEIDKRKVIIRGGIVIIEEGENNN